MPELVSQTTRAADLDLHWLEIGAGPPVLFVHGWPARAELWRNILPVVGRSHRAIALDLPGFGRSEKPLGRRYGFRFFERAIGGFLDNLGIERTGLVVHDLGGPVGLYWACRNPERVRTLGLLNTLVFPELSWAVKAFVAATHLPGVRGYLASPAGIARAMRFGVFEPAKISPEIAEMYGEPFRQRDARRALLLAAQGLGPGGLRFIAESLPQFGDIPVRIIYGEEDRILPDVAKTMARVGSLLPRARITALPRCGHFLQEDDPDLVAAMLSEFFDAPGQ